MARDFNRIPEEMRPYQQWVSWRYEEREAKKPTKIPYDPRTGKMASVTDSTTWCSFDEAVAAATAPGTSYNGIGFVLTELDPYVIIDLDDPYEMKPDGTPKFANPDKIKNLQTQVFETMDSYSEISPSGYGRHIITKARISQGRRRSNIELYYNERYMTMTGDVFHRATA